MIFCYLSYAGDQSTQVFLYDLKISRKKWVKVQHSATEMCSMLGLVVYW